MIKNKPCVPAHVVQYQDLYLYIYIYGHIYIYIFVYILCQYMERESAYLLSSELERCGFGKLIQDEERYRSGMVVIGDERNS